MFYFFKDSNVFNNSCLASTGKGFPIASLILELLTSKLSVNFWSRSEFKGKRKKSPIFAMVLIPPFEILKILAVLFFNSTHLVTIKPKYGYNCQNNS